MTEKISNNNAIVVGEIVSEFEFSHEVFGEGFYNVKLKLSRLSHASDTIPLLISERLIDVKQSYLGRFMKVKGQFRSYNMPEDGRTRLILSLFVRELKLLDEQNPDTINRISLDGYICKEPVYRTTPLGREITDILLAVNRAYGKSDYIPCIFWGRNAKYAERLPVGSRIQVSGRIQSREYQKKLSENNVITCVAYEVSANRLECCDEESDHTASSEI